MQSNTKCKNNILISLKYTFSRGFFFPVQKKPFFPYLKKKQKKPQLHQSFKLKYHFKLKYLCVYVCVGVCMLEGCKEKDGETILKTEKDVLICTRC